MNLNIGPGKYVVAVSGGVDSISLLNMLSNIGGFDIVIAHYDHGIRPDSAQDREFVQELAKKYNLPFEYAEGQLGMHASEALARNKRYEFLQEVKTKYNADAIITAHHQDDVLETIIINLLRGTGRKGLSSLRSTKELVRPLLKMTKQDLIDYATQHKLTWREDQTNYTEAYFRNWVRINIVPKLTNGQRSDLLSKQELAQQNNQVIDAMLDAYINPQHPSTLNISDITQLPHAVALELIAHWLRVNRVPEVDSKLVERVTLGSKTLKPGKTIAVKGKTIIKVAAKKLLLIKEYQQPLTLYNIASHEQKPFKRSGVKTTQE
jgi:tRNA(Ile)-lysidine synthase